MKITSYSIKFEDGTMASRALEDYLWDYDLFEEDLQGYLDENMVIEINGIDYIPDTF